MNKIETAKGKLIHIQYSDSELEEILADVAKIEDKEIRLSLMQKLGI